MSGFLETYFSCLAYYLDSQKPTSTAWPIKACVLLPGFPEDWFNSLTNQSLVLPPGLSEAYFNRLANQSLCLIIWISRRCSTV
jgi:hypothetical protein